ncbi:MAG: hypothetical protein PUI22_08495, partial [Bacteroidales bacterium]|nr:hypothetical protein [Bacteroidales bacterium]MDY5262874.1 hypothetical protein [Candidatus Cryptobacteroides sp.]
KYLTKLMAILTLAILSVACSEDGKIAVEFEKTLYTVHGGGSVDIAVNVSEPAASDISIGLLFSGSASADKYAASFDTVTIPAGETVGTVTISDIRISQEEQIVVGIVSCPSGYTPGAKSVTIVTVDAEELLVCSFATTSDNAIGSYRARIDVSGAVSGKDLSLNEDVVIPLTASGAAASYLNFGGEPHALLKAGDKVAIAEFSLNPGFEEGAEVKLSIKEGEDRILIGNNETITLKLYGAEIPEALLGTWTFDHVFALEEIEYFFGDEGDDITLLPTHNEGFTLTFEKDDAGIITVTPNDKGDFAKFFRTAAVTPTEPINYSSEGTVTGMNTVSEINMFMASEDYGVHTCSYYKLSEANRAFSSEVETLGEAVVIFTLVEGGLQVEFRDYDTPPFGEIWWDPDFDPDMFGFASLFVK